MGLNHSPRITTDGLLLCLDVANIKSYPGSGTSWFDLSGNNLNGTLRNGVTFSSPSLVFDGSNDYIECSGTAIKWTQNGSVGYTTLTIEMWIKSGDTSGGRYFSKPWNGGGQYNIDISDFAFSVWVASTPTSLSYPTTLNDGTWKQLVCWVDATNMGTYVNSSFSSSKAHGLTGGAGSSGDGSIPLALMTLYPYGEGWGGNTAFSIQGEMSVCRVYNRVLTLAEIQQNFNALRGRFGL